MKLKLAFLGALALVTLAPTIASADYRYDRGARYDRGDRYYGRGHSSHRSSSFDISIGFGSRGYRDYSYTRFGYSSRPHYYGGSHYRGPRYYERPVYVAPPPVYYSAPVYVAPAPVYVAPPPVYYHSRSTYYGGYGRPRHYYYSTGSYYHCR